MASCHVTFRASRIQRCEWRQRLLLVMRLPLRRRSLLCHRGLHLCMPHTWAGNSMERPWLAKKNGGQLALVGGLGHVFFHILGIIIPTNIFWRGRYTTNQSSFGNRYVFWSMDLRRISWSCFARLVSPRFMSFPVEFKWEYGLQNAKSQLLTSSYLEDHPNW